MSEELASKLKRLLALATLRRNEEGDETRENEARTAAFLLMKTCRDNDVTVVFKLKPKPCTEPRPMGAVDLNNQRAYDDLMDLMSEILRGKGNWAVDGIPRPPKTEKNAKPPENGRVHIHFDEADIHFDESGAPKITNFAVGWKHMHSNFDSKCKHCQGRIRFDDPIFWKKGIGSVHADCFTPFLKANGEIRV